MILSYVRGKISASLAALSEGARSKKREAVRRFSTKAAEGFANWRISQPRNEAGYARPARKLAKPIAQ
jgi:hypothetical protein